MQRTSSYSTLILLVIKDVRLENGFHQAHIAQQAGKTPSAWGKIENGQSPLNMDTFFGACVGLGSHPTYIMGLAERLIPLFNRYGWYFQNAYLGDEDELLPLIQSYYSSPGFEALKGRPFVRMSVQSYCSTFSSSREPTAVEYCCVQAFKEWMDNGAPLENSPQISMPTW